MESICWLTIVKKKKRNYISKEITEISVNVDMLLNSNSAKGAIMLHIVVEQTYKYPMRMIYNSETGVFTESEYKSLQYARNFTKPYGWIKESGTPPSPHWDCILMTDREMELGDEVEIKVVGVFKRLDLDHKYVGVEVTRDIDDISELSEAEREELKRLYPRVSEGEGWFGKEMAEYCMKNHKKSL